MKSSSGNARAVRRSATSFLPVFHVVISVKSRAPITSGSQPPCRTFTRFAPKSDRSTARKMIATQMTDRLWPFPTLDGDDREQNRRDHHRSGHGDSVRRGKSARRPEADGDEHGADGEKPIHLWHIHLAHRHGRGVLDVESWGVAELNRLARERKSTGDERLRRDDRRERRNATSGSSAQGGAIMKNGCVAASPLTSSSAPCPK